MRRTLPLLLPILFCLTSTTAGAGARRPLDPGPLELRAAQQLSPRLQELRVYSPALARETSLRVLLPEGFEDRPQHARRRLPVLWLLHGGFGSYLDWTEQGDAEAITEGLDLVVVMPDGGPGGWYTDWRTLETSQGLQRWETYHVRELVPFIHARYRTRTDRSGNGIAGLSMGGFGALHHAARHPDVFGFAAAFSGAVDNQNPGVQAVIMASPLIMGGLLGDVFGDPVLHETYWRANNPVDLAANLAHVVVELRTGNGQPGGVHGGGPDAGEEVVAQTNATLSERLDALGIPHLHEEHPGVHTWPYWRDGLRAALPGFLAVAQGLPHIPSHAEHVAFEPTFSAWGYDVALERPALERAWLSVNPHGFSLRGTGTGVVVTPPSFVPGQRVRVVTWNELGEFPLRALRAGADGRLVVPVDLGPASTVDEFARPPEDPPRFRTVHVALRPLPARRPKHPHAR